MDRQTVTGTGQRQQKGIALPYHRKHITFCQMESVRFLGKATVVHTVAVLLHRAATVKLALVAADDAKALQLTHHSSSNISHIATPEHSVCCPAVSGIIIFPYHNMLFLLLTFLNTLFHHLPL